MNKYKGRGNTHMNTYSGSGILQSTQLTKVSSSKLRKMVQEKGTPVTVRVSGGKKIIESGNKKNLRKNILTYD